MSREIGWIGLGRMGEAMVKRLTQAGSTIGSALLRVRFQTLTVEPACARRFTIASPIRPRPIHPISRDMRCTPQKR